ncbi:MAG TPA: hypothetical protein VN213_22095 [Solirubrobacteraceae bacterium]|nr:hypothetical protein [Solirubrobacteraceae bacterium]
MSDGLPDAVVEAMARVAYERAYPPGMRESWESWSERQPGAADQFRASVRAILSALPACVLVSDGKGKVTPLSDHVAVQTIARAEIEVGGWSVADSPPTVAGVVNAYFVWCRLIGRQFDPRDVAALSATDTEEKA